jgi:transcriptional regulator with XRE-family HTH domain
MSTLFKQRLQDALNEAELPEDPTERLAAFANIFNIKQRHEASLILNGKKLPDADLLDKIAQEFEVSADYLRGDSDLKTTSKMAK